MSLEAPAQPSQDALGRRKSRARGRALTVPAVLNIVHQLTTGLSCQLPPTLLFVAGSGAGVVLGRAASGCVFLCSL